MKVVAWLHVWLGAECVRGADAIDAASVVFVKYHQVGGTSAEAALTSLIDKKAMQARNVTLVLSHDTLYFQRAWADHGLPKQTFASTLLRHPGEKFLSAFCKHQFPSVPSGPAEKAAGYTKEFDHFTPSHKFDSLFGAERDPKAMWNISAVSEAIRMHTSEPVEKSGQWHTSCDCKPSEYANVMGTPEAAIDLLRQFAVVGITERLNDWVQNMCVALGPLALADVCAALRSPAQAMPSGITTARRVNLGHRVSMGHPTMADLPATDVTALLRHLQSDMLVYQEAVRLAACGPRLRVES